LRDTSLIGRRGGDLGLIAPTDGTTSLGAAWWRLFTDDERLGFQTARHDRDSLTMVLRLPQ